MKKSRVLFLVLAVLMLVGLFAGCNNTNGGRKPLEQRTFDGRSFVITCPHPTQQWLPDVETAEGEAKQAIYDQLADDLNINIEIKSDWDDPAPIVVRIIGGEVPADLASMKMHGWMFMAMQNLILPFDDPRIVKSGLDITDESAFFQPFTKAQSWNDKVYGVMWNGSHFLCEFGWCIYFNKALLADAGVTDLYKVVRDGEWDWEYFRDVAKKTTKDYDSDGVIDVYGVGTFGYGTEIFTKPGAEIIRNVDGKMKVVLNEPAALDALEFTRQFAFADNVRHPDGYGDVHRQFTDGKVAMVWGEQWNTRADDLGFRQTDVDYGLVPMPKAPGADHYVNVLGGVYSASIYSNNTDQDIEDIAYITYEMGKRFTNDDWQQMYLEKDLRGDTDALDMVVNYIWPNTVPDYVWMSIPVRENFRSNIYLPMTEGAGTPVTLVEQYQAELQAEVDALFKQ